MLSVPGKKKKALLLLSRQPAASTQTMVKPWSNLGQSPVKHRQRFNAVSAWEEEEGAAAAQLPPSSKQCISVTHQCLKAA
jgi:hypothetical protein